MASIPKRIEAIKDDLPQILNPQLITTLCEQEGHQWRERDLGPVATLRLFMMQILHGNTAISHLRHLADMAISASAYCQARQRLPLAVMQRLLSHTTKICRDAATEVSDDLCWLGHRVFHLDGSSFSMPDTPALQKHFGQPGGQKPGCGFPVAHLLLMIDAATGMAIKTLTSPLRTHDMAHAAKMHDELQAGDLLVADRGFCSYAHLALVLQAKMHGLFRIHQRTIVNFRKGRKQAGQCPKGKKKGKPTSRWLKKLGLHDQLVAWRKPKTRPLWMDRQTFKGLADELVLRELQYLIKRKGFRTTKVTLVTTLLDAQVYSAAALAEQYGLRWEIEGHLRELKQTMGMDALRCESVDGVMKELLMFVLVYNLVRLVMGRAASNQKVDIRQISFIDALRWLRVAGDGRRLPLLIVNPVRADRVEPRAKKRRPKQYPWLQEPRHKRRQVMADKGVAA